MSVPRSGARLLRLPRRERLRCLMRVERWRPGGREVRPGYLRAARSGIRAGDVVRIHARRMQRVYVEARAARRFEGREACRPGAFVLAAGIGSLRLRRRRGDGAWCGRYGALRKNARRAGRWLLRNR